MFTSKRDRLAAKHKQRLKSSNVKQLEKELMLKKEELENEIKKYQEKMADAKRIKQSASLEFKKYQELNKQSNQGLL